MNGSDFSKVNHENDLGITNRNDLKPNKYFSDVLKKLINWSTASEELLCINLKKVIHY